MNKDPERVSNALSFLTKIFEICYEKTAGSDKIRIYSIFGKMFTIFPRDQENIFYLVKCRELDGKSLLWYINSQNVRLLRQREELIDLSVKIANLNNGGNSEKAMNEVINNFKSGLASGVGLREMIIMIKERYPWSNSKKYIMILVSLVACLSGIGLFAFDLTTDIKFSLEMFDSAGNGSLPEYPTFSSVFKNKSLPGPRECWKGFEICWDQHSVVPEKKITASKSNEMTLTGWFVVWHCVQAVLLTFIVFLSMNFKYFKCSLPNIENIALPCPVLTHIYLFYLKVRSHIARSQSGFKIEMDKIERKIKGCEALGMP